MNRMLIVRLSVGAMIVLGAALLIVPAEETMAGDAVSVSKAAVKQGNGFTTRAARGDATNTGKAAAKQGNGFTTRAARGDATNTGKAAAKQNGGSITGTIKLWRARAKTKGPKSYKDVVVYLEKVGNNDIPPPTTPARIDQKGLVFIPHVLVVQKGTPIEFANNDNDKHNVYFLDDASGKTRTKDLGTWMPGEKRSHAFKESKVVTTLCKLHLEMAAYVVVLDNPFFTKVALSEGKPQRASFTIKNVPPGKYTLSTWHKKLKLKGGSQEVTVEDGKTATVDLTLTKAKYAKVAKNKE